MKNLKITLLALAVLISMPAIGMEQAPQPMEVDVSSYLLNLPADLQKEIIKILTTSGSADEAIKSIRALTLVNKRFHDLINNENVTDILITLLADRYFNGYRVSAAWNLQTVGARKWFDTENAKKWFKEYSPPFADTIRQDLLKLVGDTQPISRTRAMLLLQLGLNPNRRDGAQALFAALKKYDLDLFKALLQAGADPNTIQAPPFSDNESILEYATLYNRRLDFIDLLLAAGANPNITQRRQGRSLIEEVARGVGQEVYGHGFYWDTVLARLKNAQANRK